ncbi:MAG: hypothetical protein AAF202_02545 [Pseudomonadota bacterium]
MHLQSTLHLTLPIVFLAAFGQLTLAQMPPGFENLTDDQRNCLRRTVGSPQSGERPSRQEIQQAMETCEITRPEEGQRGSARGETGETRRAGNRETRDPRNETQPSLQSLIVGMNAYRDTQSGNARIDGYFPRACQNKFDIAVKCSDDGRIEFVFQELTSDALQCLQFNSERCADLENLSVSCIKLEEIPNAEVSMSSMAPAPPPICLDLNQSSVHLGFQAYGTSSSITEGGYCSNCDPFGSSANPSHLQAQIRDLKAVVEEQEEEIENLKRQRRRISEREDEDEGEGSRPRSRQRQSAQSGNSGFLSSMASSLMMGMTGMGGMQSMGMMGGGMPSMNMNPSMSMMNPMSYSSFGGYGGYNSMSMMNPMSYSSFGGYGGHNSMSMMPTSYPSLASYSGYNSSLSMTSPLSYMNQNLSGMPNMNSIWSPYSSLTGYGSSSRFPYTTGYYGYGR